MADLDPRFATKLAAMLRDHPDLMVASGYRSEEEQAALYDQAKATFGTRKANKMISKPEESNHVKGFAADVVSPDNPDRVRQIAPMYGLIAPRKDEPYHLEDISILGEEDGEVFKDFGMAAAAMYDLLTPKIDMNEAFGADTEADKTPVETGEPAGQVAAETVNTVDNKEVMPDAGSQ